MNETHKNTYNRSRKQCFEKYQIGCYLGFGSIKQTDISAKQFSKLTAYASGYLFSLRVKLSQHGLCTLFRSLF